jgi:hypothetical protein
MGAQFSGDRYRDIALNSKNIRQVAILALGPKGVICSRIDKPDCNSDAITIPPHRALDNVGNSKSVRDRKHVLATAGTKSHD